MVSKQSAGYVVFVEIPNVEKNLNVCGKHKELFKTNQQREKYAGKNFYQHINPMETKT